MTVCVRKIFGLFLLTIAFVVSGCASIESYYVPVPTGDAQLMDYEGELTPELAQDKSSDELILRRASEDYVLIGRADFGGPSEDDWVSAMVRQGEAVKAEKVDYFTWFDRIEKRTGVMNMPVTQTSYATVCGPRGPRTVSMTTTSTAYVPYDYNVSCNEYHVFFFKKTRNPSRFGAMFALPDDDLAKKIGTRSGVAIRAVVPEKQAWTNDLFRDDVIQEIDGQPATLTSVKILDQSAPGHRLKIWRDGKVIEKTIR